MITGGSSQDMGGISIGSTGLIFIYDGTIGGNGASKTLYEKLDKAILRAQKVLSECTFKNESVAREVPFPISVEIITITCTKWQELKF